MKFYIFTAFLLISLLMSVSNGLGEENCNDPIVQHNDRGGTGLTIDGCDVYYREINDDLRETSIVLVLQRLFEFDDNKTHFIWDMANSPQNSNRLSVFIEDGKVFFRIFDIYGKEYKVDVKLNGDEIDWKKNEWIVIKVSWNRDYDNAKLIVNNLITKIISPINGNSFNTKNVGFYLGSDIYGQNQGYIHVDDLEISLVEYATMYVQPSTVTLGPVQTFNPEDIENQSVSVKNILIGSLLNLDTKLPTADIEIEIKPNEYKDFSTDKYLELSYNGISENSSKNIYYNNQSKSFSAEFTVQLTDSIFKYPFDKHYSTLVIKNENVRLRNETKNVYTPYDLNLKGSVTFNENYITIIIERTSNEFFIILSVFILLIVLLSNYIKTLLKGLKKDILTIAGYLITSVLIFPQLLKDFILISYGSIIIFSSMIIIFITIKWSVVNKLIKNVQKLISIIKIRFNKNHEKLSIPKTP